MTQQIEITFKIYYKDETGKFPILRDETFDAETIASFKNNIRIGTGTGAQVKVDDPEVDFSHAYVQVRPDGKIVVADIPSSKPTFVRGQQLAKGQQVEIQKGDELVVGNTKIIVHFVTPQDVAAAEAPEAGAAEAGAAAGPFVAAAVDTSQYSDPSKKQVLVVKSYLGDTLLQSNVLMDHKNGEKVGPMAYLMVLLGFVVAFGGLGLFFYSLEIVKERQREVEIIKEIARDRGLSDKYVPQVRGDVTVEYSSIALMLLGASILFGGLTYISIRKRILANFTIGEDPEAVLPVPSKELPSHRFPLIKSDRVSDYHLLFTENMDGSITDPSGYKYTLTELVERGKAGPSAEFGPGVHDYVFPDNHTAELHYKDYKWVIKSSPAPRVVLPMDKPDYPFFIPLLISFLLSGFLAWYMVSLQSDEWLGEEESESEEKIAAVIKKPMVVAQQKKEQKKVELKDKDKIKPQKNLKVVKTKTKDVGSKRDPRSKAKGAGQGGAGSGFSRTAGAQGIGVANVLQSQLSAMTANLTASNTVFGAETETLDDFLDDGDSDGEAIDGGFGGRGGAGGSGGGGGLGIGGGGGTGWGGIGLGGGGGLGGRFGSIGGAVRKRVTIRQGRADVSGKLDPNEVRAVIRIHRNEVRHCYQKGLMANDKLGGKVRVVFYINPMGRVERCSVVRNLSIPIVGQCICNRLSTWRFPQPQGGLAKVGYEWTFNPPR